MPELFKVSEGPWKKLFSGKFQDQEVEIYINPKSVLLVAIYEMEEDKPKGAVIEMYKVLASSGELEEFVATLPREVIVLTKHTKEETIKYFMLGTSPSYVEYKEDEFLSETDSMLKKLKTSSTMIKDISKAYDLTLQELNDASEDVKAGFFTQPLLIPAVATASHPGAAPSAGAQASGAARPHSIGGTKGEVLVGLTKEGNKIVEPLSLLMQTIVSGGSEEDRVKALQVIAEGALLSGVPVIVFDWGDVFSAMAEGTKDREGLKKYKVDSEPIGFPVRNFDSLKELVVEVSTMNPEGLLQLFGAGEDNSVEIITETMRNTKSKGFEELVKNLKKTKADEHNSAYQIKKAVRIVRLIGLRYPKMYEGTNDIESLIKSRTKGIGRAAIINISEPDERLALMLVHSIVSGIYEYCKKQGKSKLARALIIMPEAGKAIPYTAKNVLSEDIAKELVEITQYGIGHVLSSARPADVSKSVGDRIEAKINIVKGNDAGVSMKDRKSYRAFIRPGLSNIRV